MNYTMDEMLMEIDKSMPKEEQIGEYLKAKEIPTEDLKIGDTVILMDYNGKTDKHKIIGFGKDEFVNGTKVNGVPYVDMFGNNDGDFSWNINNYIRTETVRVVKEV